MMQEPETLYKLMTLYMLDKVSFPLTNSQLSHFFLEKDYTTYFTLQSVLNDLVEANLISSRQSGNSTYYEISDDGRQTLEFFVSDISEAAIADMNEYLDANRLSMRSESGLTADYFKAESEGYIVHCTAREGKTTMLSLDIAVPDEHSAEYMCANWKSCSRKIYSDIMHRLINTPAEE